MATVNDIVTISNASLLLKKESSYAADPTVATGDGICAFDLKWDNSIEALERANHYCGTWSANLPIIGAKSQTLEFSTYAAGEGNAGTAPDESPAIQACGLAEVVVGGASVTYAPASTSICSAYAYVYHPKAATGLLAKFAGLRGTFGMSIEPGQPLKYTFSMAGRHIALSDATPVAPTIANETPKAGMGASLLTIGSDTFITTKFELNMDSKQSLVKDFNQTYGIYSNELTGRQPKGTIEIAAPLVASKDIESLLGTKLTLVLTLNNAAGNIITITMYAAPLTFNVVNGDGVLYYSIPFALVKNSSGDDEISIAYT